jgi:hypothetical protein
MFPSFFHMADSMLTTSLIVSVVFFVAALVSAFVGLAIRVYMAERVRLEHARDMIGGVTGLVVTLVALVLGLLIWTAFGVFSPADQRRLSQKYQWLETFSGVWGSVWGSNRRGTPEIAANAGDRRAERDRPIPPKTEARSRPWRRR